MVQHRDPTPHPRSDERANREHGDYDRPKIREEPRGVWLVIRYDSADAGVRPIPDGDVFWLSPDIWITGGDEWGNAIAGRPMGVHARVWNLGKFPATPTRVDFSFVAPALGIPRHAPQRIGTAWVSIPPLSTVEVDCPNPWVPAAFGLTHACLIVTCTTQPLDPAVSPYPKGDRHTGQRNVTIVQARPGQVLNFDLLVAPVLGQVVPLQVGASALLVEGDLPAELPMGSSPSCPWGTL